MVCWLVTLASRQLQAYDTTALPKLPYPKSRTPQIAAAFVTTPRRLLGGRRQISDQTHRHGQLIQLEMRPEERYSPVRPGSSRNLEHLDASLLERLPRLHVEGHAVVRHDVVVDPAV